MKHEGNEPKIGAGHLSAMARLGLRELRGALYPESNVAQQPEHGTFGTLTPGEIAEAKGATSLDPEQEKDRESVLDGRLEQAAGRDDHGRDPREPERE